MTISREYRDGPFVCQCDECLDTDELDGETLRDASQDAQTKGFTPKLQEDRWKHYCRYCS